MATTITKWPVTQKQMYFNPISGHVSFIESDIVCKKPKANCNHCYGRGYSGRNLKTQQYVPCRCIKAKNKKNTLKGHGV